MLSDDDDQHHEQGRSNGPRIAEKLALVQAASCYRLQRDAAENSVGIKAYLILFSSKRVSRLTEFIHVEHGQDGVRAFAIHPGGVPTGTSSAKQLQLASSLWSCQPAQPYNLLSRACLDAAMCLLACSFFSLG